MNLNQLEIFHAAATAGSMTGAAAALSISQPAVSKQVRQFERTLGVALFERGVRRLELTKAGAALHAHAREIFASVAAAERDLADLSSLRRGTLAIGATPTLGAYVLPDALLHFRRRFPEITARLEIGSAAHLTSLVSEASLDVVISDVAMDTDRSVSRQYGTESLVIIAPRGHPLARRRSVSAAALADEPFVVRETGSTSRSFAERAMAGRGVAIHATLSLASTEAIKRAVAGGIGLAIVPAASVTTEVAAKLLSIIRVPQLALRRPLYVTTKRGIHESKATIAFLCLMKHSLRGSLPKLASTTGLR